MGGHLRIPPTTYDEILYKHVFYPARAATAKYHRQNGLKKKNLFFFIVLEAESPRSRS